MENERAKILEDQLDAVAGKVKTLEEQVSAMVEVLSRRENEVLLHITSSQLAKLTFPTRPTTGAYRHSAERNKQVDAALREAEITRLITERRQKDHGDTQARG